MAQQPTFKLARCEELRDGVERPAFKRLTLCINPLGAGEAPPGRAVERLDLSGELVRVPRIVVVAEGYELRCDVFEAKCPGGTFADSTWGVYHQRPLLELARSCCPTVVHDNWACYNTDLGIDRIKSFGHVVPTQGRNDDINLDAHPLIMAQR